MRRWFGAVSQTVNSRLPGLLWGISLASALGALVTAGVEGFSVVARHGASLVAGGVTTAVGDDSCRVWGVGAATWLLSEGSWLSVTSSGSEDRGVLGTTGSMFS